MDDLDRHTYGDLAGFSPEFGFGLQAEPVTLAVPSALDAADGQALLKAVRYLARMAVPVTVHLREDDSSGLAERLDELIATGWLPGVTRTAMLRAEAAEEIPLTRVMEAVKWRYPHFRLLVLSRDPPHDSAGRVPPLVTEEALTRGTVHLPPEAHDALAWMVERMDADAQRGLHQVHVVPPDRVIPALFTQRAEGTLIARLRPVCTPCTPGDVRLLWHLLNEGRRTVPPLTAADHPADVAELAAMHGAFLKATVDDRRVPAGCLRVSRPLQVDGVAVLHVLVMAARFAGATLAEALLRAAERQGRNVNAHTVALVDPDPALMPVLEALDYTPVGADDTRKGMPELLAVAGERPVMARPVSVNVT